MSMSRSPEQNAHIRSLGAILSDLIAGTYALATEDEIGEDLVQRISELKASAGALVAHLDAIKSLDVYFTAVHPLRF